MQKTKFQQLMDSPKGCLEFNPNQSFALHLLWIVRSPTAAAEMLQKGFRDCAKASMRDTPTTLTYFFRIAHDQTVAHKYRQEILTIGQHPHYQSCFKSLEMGLPVKTMETKLSFGGIDVAPLNWPQDELIEAHPELDFDPVVLECTEVYLDNRSFYDHSCSRDWMKSSQEILKACRSLKPVTYCIGHPSDQIWEQTLESYLKAIRTEESPNSEVIDVLYSGLFIQRFTDLSVASKEIHCFLEMTIHVLTSQASSVSEHLTALQHEIKTIYTITLPLPSSSSSRSNELKQDHENQEEDPLREVRVMVAFCLPAESPPCGSNHLSEIHRSCVRTQGRLIFNQVENEDSLVMEMTAFLAASGVDHFAVMNNSTADTCGGLEGYIIHPRYTELVPNERIDYKP
jgi:hypothetical protein